MTPDLATTAALVRYDLKIGRAWVAAFATPEGDAVLEYHAPNGMRGDDSFLSGRPRGVLWRSGAPPRVLADVDLAAREAVAPALDAAEARAAEVAGAERPLLDLLLRLVREHHLGTNRRPRAARVAASVTSCGRPSSSAWASCLTLADLQAALLAALEPGEARAA